jgi:hypothetical protein
MVKAYQWNGWRFDKKLFETIPEGWFATKEEAAPKKRETLTLGKKK